MKFFERLFSKSFFGRQQKHPETETAPKVSPESACAQAAAPQIPNPQPTEEPNPDFQIKNGVLTKYTGSGGHVTIPEGVRKIGKRAFTGCKPLTDVVIPEGVEEIGEKAFMFCESLTSVSLPSTLRKLDEGCFLHCSTLPEIVIPEGTAEIGNDAFYSCPRLEKVVLPRSLQTIGTGAFVYCGKLQKIRCAAVIPGCSEDVFRVKQGEAGVACEWVTDKEGIWLRKKSVQWSPPRPAFQEKTAKPVPVRENTQDMQDREDDAYLNSLSYADLHPYPLDPRAREIIQKRNSRR